MTALTWLLIGAYAHLDPPSYWFGVATPIALWIGWWLGGVLSSWWRRHRP